MPSSSPLRSVSPLPTESNFNRIRSGVLGYVRKHFLDDAVQGRLNYFGKANTDNRFRSDANL